MRGVGELAVDMDQGRLAGAVELAGVGIDIGGLDRGGHLVDADIAGGQRRGIHLHARGIGGGALHIDLGHAAQGRELAAEQIFRVFVQLIERHGIRLDRGEEDRRVGGIDFAQGGRADGMFTGNWRAAAWIARQHVLRRAVDVAVQVELDGDRRCGPSELCDVIEVTPGMVENWLSSGVATADAMVDGSAPGRLAETKMVGKSTGGNSLTGKVE